MDILTKENSLNPVSFVGIFLLLGIVFDKFQWGLQGDKWTIHDRCALAIKEALPSPRQNNIGSLTDTEFMMMIPRVEQTHIRRIRWQAEVRCGLCEFGYQRSFTLCVVPAGPLLCL